MEFDTDVLVIGAGPVGLMLTNLLGTYGQNVTLLRGAARAHRLPPRRRH